MNFDFRGRRKREFLEEYRGDLASVYSVINEELDAKYRSDVITVKEIDFWVLFNCECGLKNGFVSDSYPHNEGEKSILPLPSNIRDWNGSDAPDGDKPMTPEVNIRHFIRYLGNVKNKKAAHRDDHWFYRDTFRLEGIVGNDVKQAKLLAGVVHGYFGKNRYDRGRSPVPFDHIVDGYRNDQDLTDFMLHTRYVHAVNNPEYLVGREVNIKAALSWL